MGLSNLVRALPGPAIFSTGTDMFKHFVCKKSRSLHDRNRFLLTSFLENDISEITSTVAQQKCSSLQKTNRIFTDVACFMECVCEDLKTLYPSTGSDYNFIKRLLQRFMTKSDAETEE